MGFEPQLFPVNYSKDLRLMELLETTATLYQRQ